ncbi:Protein translocase subunit SecA [Geodia barretti]|uniref:Protein translocase subunit SecA n=1 Tax=Geodia barretti TaxID=519541 RepID=A0AA35WC76_GEOBA|nr:Protein translocase subunit SecA [Geodia barretti]
MVSVLQKILGDPNEKALKKLGSIKGRVNALEHEFQSLTDEQLRSKTDEFRQRLQGREGLDDLLAEAFATVRESARRNLGQRHYDVQIIGGTALHEGKIAEMRTGEGKTLVATLAVYANALPGRGVHVVTVNDYLARRDPVWMGPVYHALGLTVGCLQHDTGFVYDPNESGGKLPWLRQVSREEAYLADITYGTNNEFGFDYLRDNMALSADRRVQRELNYAIVDEVDNILIDEARTPLIISGPAEEPVQLYQSFARLVPRLDPAEDYTIDDRSQAISLTQDGIAKMEQWTNTSNLYDPENFHLVHYMENALTAYVMKQRDKDYVLRDGEVVIVDEFTGRLQPGRRWSDGLHQAVEAKEGLRIQRESITYATVTLQNYFRMYEKLAGMTGTAATEADEFFRIYGLEVVEVPTNQSMQRQDLSDLVYQSGEGKWKAVADKIVELHETQQPLLIGTTSIEDSEFLSERLRRLGVRHQVLNAKNHEGEASIISQAGRLGAVTVSTNMAGRGTDIVLGGADTTREDWQQEHDHVVELGGLYVLGTEHHDARRIDNQLRGRAGRQGDPGSSQFYVSLEDELMQRFGGDRIKTVMGWTGLEEDTPVENKLVTKSISGAQVKVEGYHFDMRKHLLEFDDVLNKQREVIYGDRHQALDGGDLREKTLDMLRQSYTRLVGQHLPGRHSDDWNPGGLIDELGQIGPVPKELDEEEKVFQYTLDHIMSILSAHAEATYAEREESIGSEQMRLTERFLLMRAIDSHWIQHLTAMENLRTGIGLHAYGQRDPLVMYRSEGQKMFHDLQDRIQRDVVRTLFHVAVDPAQMASQMGGNGSSRRSRSTGSPMRAVSGPNRNAQPAGGAKVGRNASCPCGSGRKYKRCCGKAA